MDPRCCSSDPSQPPGCALRERAALGPRRVLGAAGKCVDIEESGSSRKDARMPNARAPGTSNERPQPPSRTWAQRREDPPCAMPPASPSRAARPPGP